MQLASMAIVIALLIGITAGVISAGEEGHGVGLRANVFALWGCRRRISGSASC